MSRGRDKHGAFQYPQADRRGCNSFSVNGDEINNFVSVSTSGSKGVQPILAANGYTTASVSVSTSGSKGVQQMNEITIVGRLGRFSIHKRIEGGATRAAGYIRRGVLVFQYPQADRRGCNNTRHTVKLNLFVVSVSTSGSKGVQLTGLVGAVGMTGRFSIHKRIEGGATWICGWYLDSISPFQYPQADRRGCNSMFRAEAVNFRLCFSIHKRIEGGATILHKR